MPEASRDCTTATSLPGDSESIEGPHQFHRAPAQERPRAPKHSNAQGFNMFCSPQTRVDHADICRTFESIVDPECSFQCFKLYSK